MVSIADLLDVILLQDKKMLYSTQRLIAFAILHQTYASQKSSANPFINFIINVSESIVYMKIWKFFFNLVVFTSSLQKKFDNNFLAYLDDCVNKSDSYFVGYVEH